MGISMNDKNKFVYSGSDNLEVMAAAISYNNYLTDIVDANLGSGSRILDFGAGIGTFAEFLRVRDRRILCLEPDEAQADILRQRGFEVVSDPHSIGEGTLDSIYSLNVLEHIDDDYGALNLMYQGIRTGGKLILYVPAFQLLFSSMDRKVNHYRRYRLKPLTVLLEQSGFKVSEARYVDCIGFLASLIFRFVGNKSGDIEHRSIEIYDRFIFPMSLFLDKILGRWVGKNLFIVAEKL